MGYHFTAKLSHFFFNYRSERILDTTMKYFVSCSDHPVFFRFYRIQLQKRLSTGHCSRMFHLCFFNYKRNDSRTGQLVSFFYAESGRAGGDHHLSQSIYLPQTFHIYHQKSVNICDQLDLTLFWLCRMHICALAHISEDLCRIVFMQHVFVIFPDIDVILTHTQKYRDIFFPDYMSFTKNCILGHPFDNLGNIMT